MSHNAPPSPKRARRDVKRFARLLSSGTEFNKKFKLTTGKISFLIEDLPANPESLLYALFDYSVEEARKAAIENGIKPDRFGLTISSRLLNPEIWIPIRDFHTNTIDSVLNRFLSVAQSKTNEGSLWGEPFQVDVTVLEHAALPRQQQIRGRGHRTPKGAIHQVNPAHLLQVKNRDNYCLFYALEISRIYHSNAMSKVGFCRYMKQLNRQQRDAHQLMQEVGIPLNESDYEATKWVKPVVDFWNARYAPHIFKVFVFGELGHYKPEHSHGPDKFTIAIPLFHHQHHFDGIRFGVGSSLFGRDQYCFACECPFDNNVDHTTQCTARCFECGRVGVGRPCKPDDGFQQDCAQCCKRFKNSDCYQHHLTSNHCARSKRCEKCGKIYSVKYNTRDGRKGHACEERFCRTCRTYHDPKRGCFIQPLKPRKSHPYRLVAFDCETTQNREVEPGKRIHEVNFISAVVVCTECLKTDCWRQSLVQRGEECKICGPHRSVTFSHREYYETRTDSGVRTDEPIAEFVQWLLRKFDNRYPTVVFSHYGGRFDNVLVYRALIDHKFVPQMITKGNKLYEMRVPRTNLPHGIGNPELIFRDSWNLMSVPLGSLVGAFGLQTQEKEFFPHLANVRENYDRVLDELPPKEDYMYGGMSKEKQKKFDEWYGEHRHERFNLNEQLASYCMNDTQILIEALVAFRQEFLKISAPKRDDVEMELGLHGEEEHLEGDEDLSEDSGSGSGGIDICWEPLTIASASMRHFRLNHLQQDQLALVPERGYDTADNQSEGAMKFFQWYEERYGVDLQTAHSPGGEHKIGRYTVDAYIPEEDTVIEYNGCHWHCHENCSQNRFNPELMMPCGKTVRKIRENDEVRLAFLKTQVEEVKVYWECEVKKMLRQSPQMQRAYQRYHDRGPIQLRDCYFGGRTGPLRLHFEVPEGWKMKLFDVRSLYPNINSVTQYPQGHPTRINVMRGDQILVDWQRAEDIPVRGILKVFVVPPPRVDVPVLPVKFDERLLFPLCRACSMQYKRGGVKPNYRCGHSDEERGWVSTVTSIELEEALRNGYRCTRYYRSIEWDDEHWSDEIFKGYIAEFQKLKTEASGFPEELSTREEQDEYVRECEEMFGIQIDRENMVHNKAKRTIAKFCNNSLWGRFSLRNGLSKTEVTDSPARLRQMLDDPKIEVDAIDQLNKEVVLVRYTPVKDWVEEHNCSNVIMSLWTTSAARIHLLKLMQKVVRAPNAVLLYTDTDSLCFAYKEADGCPLETGPHLGQLSDEYPQFELKEFVSGGCKQYALRMTKNGEEKHILKVRGITLSADACKKLHFATFKESVLNYGNGESAEDDEEEEDDDQEEIVLEYPYFIRPSLRDGRVLSVSLSKRYRPIVSKAVVGPNLTLIDFGTK